MEKNPIQEGISEYYGKELKGSKDLKTNACCCSGSMPPEIKAVLPSIDDEILNRFYGCGSPIPPLLEGKTVLDLGCGTGRDVYIASKLVGESGHVIGVDMTQEQLSVAERHIENQMTKFGYSKPNVEFKLGFIEDLKGIGIEDNSVDVVISNCVINLSTDKEKVFSEIFRVLKKGGELYFSDVFADRRVPKEVYDDPILRGECLGGAMYVEDFRRLMSRVGFIDFRYTSVSDITVNNDEIRKLLGKASFTSRTVRAFKLDDLEDCCEDYGQMASYMGNIPGHPEYFDLDNHHRFYRCQWQKICGNTASMLSNTRFELAFAVSGNRKVHQGKFENCGETIDNGPCCCCK